jgi:DNA-binding protein HU-beta
MEMNKNDLISAVTSTSGTSKADAAKAVDAVCNVITDALSRGEEVRLTGFGSFSVANRSARVGRNPRTGEPINIPASRQPKFKAGKQLKGAVNG